MPVLDFISRYISPISLALVTTAAIFNVGYFWKIGIHFLGIVDLSNLVYSFALATTFVFAWVQVAYWVTPTEPSSLNLTAIAIVGAAISLTGFMFGSEIFHDAIIEDFVTLLGLMIIGVGALAFIRMRYAAEGSLEVGTKVRFKLWGAEVRAEVSGPFTIALAALVFFGTIFQAGIWTSDLALINPKTFSVTTKDGRLQNARILRASSSGFLIAADQRIIFIPQGEVKEVKSSTDLFNNNPVSLPEYRHGAILE